MDFHTILFDLDGTIIDSSIGITNSVAYALRFYGIEADKSSLLKFIGPPLIEAFEKFDGFSEAQAKDALRHLQEYYSKEGIFESHLYDGMEQLLSDLKSAGKTLLLATSEPEVYANRILKHFNIRQYFACVVGSDIQGVRAEKAAVIAEALKRCNITDLPGVLMVGDREYDILAAKQAGIHTLGVLYGFGGKEELEHAGAEYLAWTVEEIRTLLL